MSEITAGKVWLRKKDTRKPRIECRLVMIHQKADSCLGESWTASYFKGSFLEKFSSITSEKLLSDYLETESECIEDYLGHLFEVQKDNTPRAVQILNEAVSIMAERGKSYDKSGGEAERSMPKIVAMFNALTGHELTPEQGWKFMCCLKLARSEQGEYREDNYLDGAAYMALAGEEAEASSE
ncbi:DUF6378 domain-containing protein [Psychrobacter namhaensis]|uniref:DUF6378 domain-containing protein n=1 Tax=Psychrobacter namhaensis TaxID=292734 RepID=A0ABW8L8U9_9GAMM